MTEIIKLKWYFLEINSLFLTLKCNSIIFSFPFLLPNLGLHLCSLSNPWPPDRNLKLIYNTNDWVSGPQKFLLLKELCSKFILHPLYSVSDVSSQINLFKWIWHSFRVIIWLQYNIPNACSSRNKNTIRVVLQP